MSKISNQGKRLKIYIINQKDNNRSMVVNPRDSLKIVNLIEIFMEYTNPK